MGVESFVDISHDNLYKNNITTQKVSDLSNLIKHESICAYRFPGRIKHTTCSLEYSHMFWRCGWPKFHDFDGRG